MFLVIIFFFHFILLIHCNNDKQLLKSANYYGNYTCDEITRWLGIEKHYSNQNKEVLFNILKKQSMEYFKQHNEDYCISYKEPVVYLHDVIYTSRDGLQSAPAPTFSQLIGHRSKKKYKNGVIFLSNFSINNNYSHFLHGLLRLFCALLDAQWIIYNELTQLFEFKEHYQLLVDPLVKVNPTKMKWLSAFVANPTDIILLRETHGLHVDNLLYGNGCFKLLPPEKWYGYPGCRATTILPTFSVYMKNVFDSEYSKIYHINDRVNNMYLTLQENGYENTNMDTKFNYPIISRKMPLLSVQMEYIKKFNNMKSHVYTTPVIPIIAFAIRQNVDTPQTGMRSINKLFELQESLATSLRIPSVITNITFEQYDVPTTIDIMSSIHVFISVHGAGMTNMFFMNRDAVVIEIIPWPLCTCKSPDYFYGQGGYYHGSAIALGVRHYAYCVEEENTIWSKSTNHMPKESLQDDSKCSWKYLHSVDSVNINPSKFVSLYQLIEREFIMNRVVTLHSSPIITMNPNANG